MSCTKATLFCMSFVRSGMQKNKIVFSMMNIPRKKHFTPTADTQNKFLTVLHIDLSIGSAGTYFFLPNVYRSSIVTCRTKLQNK